MSPSPRHAVARLFSAVVASAALLVSISARADGGAQIPAAAAHIDDAGHVEGRVRDHATKADHEDERWFTLGAAGIGLASFKKGQTPAAEGGFVATFEFTVIPDWLEIEIGAHYIRCPNKTFELPLDMIFKKPWHVTKWLEPYVGLGPTMVPVFGPEETRMHFGLATTAGTHFWLSHNFGLQAELNYNMVSDHGFVQQLAGVSGVVAAW